MRLPPRLLGIAVCWVVAALAAVADSAEALPLLSMNATVAQSFALEVRGMFSHTFSNYMRLAFPRDELRPISCVGHDSWGPYALTLIDSLDTLALMGFQQEFENGIRYVLENVHFNRPITVSVFETNIRVVGGLLSAHLLASRQDLPCHVPWYNASLQPNLLDKALDLALRLAPAFDTATGIPFGMVNLRSGVLPGESRVTSTAGAGTFLIEFGILSRLRPEAAANLEATAKTASRSIFGFRSRLGLIGNHINVDSGDWTLKDAGIGAGTDSFLEYLVKAYILFADTDAYDMFMTLFESIERHLHKGPWYFDANVDAGTTTWPLFNSLQGFWPGLLAMLGRFDEAAATQRAFHGVWRQFGAVPEGFHVVHGSVQNGQRGYPLRPELMESAYYLYRGTRDPIYLQMGVDYVAGLRLLRTECGFHSLADVETRQKEDRMESFFLSETLKYLYLLFSTDHWFHDHQWVFNTEGHPIPTSYDYLESNVDDAKASFQWPQSPERTLVDLMSVADVDLSELVDELLLLR